jgi:hypothetical protein
MTIQEIEREAAAIARRGEETKEQAFTRLLESNPEAYASYRARHGSRVIVETLRAAGVKV